MQLRQQDLLKRRLRRRAEFANGLEAAVVLIEEAVLSAIRVCRVSDDEVRLGIVEAGHHDEVLPVLDFHDLRPETTNPIAQILRRRTRVLTERKALIVLFGPLQDAEPVDRSTRAVPVRLAEAEEVVVQGF